jgi:hypothetical protein
MEKAMKMRDGGWDGDIEMERRKGKDKVTR